MLTAWHHVTILIYILNPQMVNAYSPAVRQRQGTFEKYNKLLL